MKYLILLISILIMTACNAFGSLLFKSTMSRVKVFSIKQTLKTRTLYFGILCYLAGSMINIFLMHYWDYSTVYPMTSCSCVWLLLFSNWFIGEKITGHKIIGLSLIIAGTFLICL
ncbi:EamA family transporter [Treponema sp.]|uniref:EamA family transporter n=1 Tax=Treponema sp. TaxID=166 RepID=UPI00298D6BB8|nr:EamA family transporter [Treponema sp.]MCR5614136.1 DMT family transporter [Treponema sp.]